MPQTGYLGPRLRTPSKSVPFRHAASSGSLANWQPLPCPKSKKPWHWFLRSAPRVEDTEMSSPTGADTLIRRLKEHGVRHIFGYPGGQLTPLYDAIYRDGEIRHVLARDE